MALTNAQLLRELAGDPGFLVREPMRGNGGVAFYLKSPPLKGDSTIITVGGTVYTEAAAAPGATEYTLDDAIGLITFGAAPATPAETAVDNIIASYYSVDMPDSVVVEALRQFGLTDTATADSGPAQALMEAAALACDIMAARHTNDFNISVDGQSLSLGNVAENWRKRAEQIRTTFRQTGGLRSMPLIRVDGYNTTDTDTQDVAAIDTSGRRKFYGQEDQLP